MVSLSLLAPETFVSGSRSRRFKVNPKAYFLDEVSVLFWLSNYFLF
jgi:hypothetical protein